ncbi:MAG: serine/threonine-protein kinase, partial [Pyrinomonadaceae bacterium]
MFHENKSIGGYTLIRKLGKGGFGEVWLGEKRIGDVASPFAIKFPQRNKIAWKKVAQEIGLWVLAGKHANVLSFEEAKNLLEPEELKGQIIIVSEFIQNGSLKDFIESENSPQIRLEIKKATEIIIDILKGLSHLHSSGIIHHDIKPGNILMKGETAVLADFGISRIITETDTTLSQTIFGTPTYMAPEARLGTRNEQTDIWSVGITLYELVMGGIPFTSENPNKITWDEKIPKPLKKIIEKSLNPIPDLRYKTAQEMLADLESFLSRSDSKNTPSAESLEEETEEYDSNETLWKPRDYSLIKKAIKDISSQTNQINILKTLTSYLHHFTPRGVLFLVKFIANGDQFIAWRDFGKETANKDEHLGIGMFEVTENSILAESYKSFLTESAEADKYDDFSIFLNKLKFKKPAKMYSVPLIVRG